MTDLQDKTLVMLVAPSAMGKSAIAAKLPTIDERFSRVRGFTTRSRRADDTLDQFYYYSDQELHEKRLASKVLTELAFPNTGFVYGTVPESYKTEFCVLETLAHTVTMYEQLPFATTYVVSVVCPVEQWQRQFLERYPKQTIEAWTRLQEATSSLNWSLETSNRCWLINDSTVDEAALRLQECVLGNHSRDDGAVHAREILACIEEGVW